MSTQLQWNVYWEHQLQPEDHSELAEFFRATYGAVGVESVRLFEGTRSWAGARPELRVIARDDNGVAAHVSVLRRFIRLDTIDQLVGDLGLYAVRSDLQGLGVGTRCLDAMHSALHELGVPFAFGSPRHSLREHFEKAWRGRATIIPGLRVRSARPGAEAQTCIEDLFIFVVPITRVIEDWPAGDLIDRNGSEV